MKKETIIGTLLGIIIGVISSNLIINKRTEKNNSKVYKFKSYYNLLNKWLLLLHDGKKIEIYLKNKGYKTIAIYGMGEIGNRLYEELKDSEIEVKYAIDKNPMVTYSGLNVKNLEDELEEVDVVVVTAVFMFETISEEIKGRLQCPIVSLEDIIFCI